MSASRPTPAPAGSAARRRIALVLADLGGAGVQRMTLALARGLAERGHQVDILLYGPTGEAQVEIPPGIDVHVLQPSSRALARLLPVLADPGGLPRMLLPVLLALKPVRGLEYILPLARHLRRHRTDALIASTPFGNLVAIWARRLARTGTRVLISERSAPSQMLSRAKKWRARFLPTLMHRTYPQADVVVAVSRALAEDLALVASLPRNLVRTIYNPVVGPDLQVLAARPVEHPWFAPGQPPVLLGVGRLSDQKDFATLVRAFARLRKMREARLVILGATVNTDKAARRQAQLMALARKLGVAEDVALLGFVDNPFAYMARAAVLVVSSRYEGLPGVLIQAMACGCAVVSTDCPTGPREILEGGRYGPLVTVGDVGGMAQAIAEVLERPLAPGVLRQRSLAFTAERAVSSYLTALFPESQPQVVPGAEKTPEDAAA